MCGTCITTDPMSSVTLFLEVTCHDTFPFQHDQILRCDSLATATCGLLNFDLSQEESQ